MSIIHIAITSPFHFKQINYSRQIKKMTVGDAPHWNPWKNNKSEEQIKLDCFKNFNKILSQTPYRFKITIFSLLPLSSSSSPHFFSETQKFLIEINWLHFHTIYTCQRWCWDQAANPHLQDLRFGSGPGVNPFSPPPVTPSSTPHQVFSRITVNTEISYYECIFWFLLRFYVFLCIY